MGIESRLKYKFGKIKKAWATGYRTSSSTEVVLQAYEAMMPTLQTALKERDYASMLEVLAVNSHNFPFRPDEDKFVQVNARIQMKDTIRDIKRILEAAWDDLAPYFIEEKVMPNGLISPVKTLKRVKDDTIVLQRNHNTYDFRLINGSTNNSLFYSRFPRKSYVITFDNEGNVKDTERSCIQVLNFNAGSKYGFQDSAKIYFARKLYNSLKLDKKEEDKK